MFRFHEGSTTYEFVKHNNQVILYCGLDYVARGTVQEWEYLIQNITKSKFPIKAGPNLLGAYYERLNRWYFLDPCELNPITPTVDDEKMAEDISSLLRRALLEDCLTNGAKSDIETV